MDGYDIDEVTRALNSLQLEAYAISDDHGFHGEPDDRSIPMSFMRLALIHTEVAEATEELRHKEIDWAKFVDELADIIIRTVDLAEVHGLNIGDAVTSKMEQNRARPFKHGKTF
jgi:NTP pyrophosphatase (non-canonical NTP hydrolase)